MTPLSLCSFQRYLAQCKIQYLQVLKYTSKNGKNTFTCTGLQKHVNIQIHILLKREFLAVFHSCFCLIFERRRYFGDVKLATCYFEKRDLCCIFFHSRMTSEGEELRRRRENARLLAGFKSGLKLFFSKLFKSSREEP